MTSPTPPAGWPVLQAQPVGPEPPRPYGSAFFSLTGLSAVTGAIGGFLSWLVIIALRGLLDGIHETAGNDPADDPGSAIGPALISGFIVFFVVLAFGAGCLALLRTSDGYARMPTFVQGLLAWLLGLVPSSLLALAFVLL